MSNAREQARDDATGRWVGQLAEQSIAAHAADAASDVWEPLYDAAMAWRDKRAEEISLDLKDLIAKLQFMVDWADANGYLPDHSFTFPDGETWEARRA